ncbi:MAG: hypothetical protein V9G04_17280 [Nocardioides sp.]
MISLAAAAPAYASSAIGLKLEVTADKTVVALGETVTIVFTLTNMGPDEEPNGGLAITLGSVFDVVSYQGTPGTYSNNLGFDGWVLPVESMTFTVVAKRKWTGDGWVDGQAYGSNPDPYTGDNTVGIRWVDRS